MLTPETTQRMDRILEKEAQIAALKEGIAAELAHLRIDLRVKTLVEAKAALAAYLAERDKEPAIVAKCSTCDAVFTEAEFEALPEPGLHNHGGGQPLAQINRVVDAPAEGGK